MNIVFLDANTIGEDVSLEPISELGHLRLYSETKASEVNERIKSAEVLIVNKVKIGKENIDAAPHLKLICEAATGVNNIDVTYAESKGIPVKNVAGYSTESVAQVTFMHILNLVGNPFYFDDYVKSGRYSSSGCFTDVSHPFYELKGKKLGIIAMGNIGSRVAEIASVFGMNVSYFSTSGTGHNKNYPSVSLDELLSESDIVTIHAPLNEKTLNLIQYDDICKMKPGAYIVNMGRGGIINEEDLVKALNDKKIAGAAIDVFVDEPIPAYHPYITGMKNPLMIKFTPHIGWTTREARIKLVSMIADNIKTIL